MPRWGPANAGPLQRPASFDGDFDGLGLRRTQGAGDGQSVSGCFLGGYVEAAVVRGPDAGDWRVQGHGPGVGDVVTELGRLAGADGGGGDVESADSELGPTELLDGGAVVGETLFGGFLRVAAFECTVGFVTGNDDENGVRRGDREGGEHDEGAWLEAEFPGFWRSGHGLGPEASAAPSRKK